MPGHHKQKESMGNTGLNCTSSNLFKEIFEVLSQAGSIGTDGAKCAIYEMSHNRAYSQWLSLSASRLGLQHMVQQRLMQWMAAFTYCPVNTHFLSKIDEPFGWFHTLQNKSSTLRSPGEGSNLCVLFFFFFLSQLVVCWFTFADYTYQMTNTSNNKRQVMINNDSLIISLKNVTWFCCILNLNCYVLTCMSVVLDLVY